MSQSLLAKLKIKTGSCKRLNKDLDYYKKEELQQHERIEKNKNEGADHSTIKKQEEVLAESLMMISDSRNRLENALQDLKDHMLEIKNNEGENGPIQMSAEWKEAQAVRDQVETVCV